MGAISGAGSAFFQRLTDVQRVEVLRAIVDAIDRTYIMVIVGGGVSLILAIFMKREKLDLEGAVKGESSN